MAVQIRATTRSNMMDEIATDLGTSCYIRIYSGTRPATPATALSGNTLLAELRGNASAFAAAASSGVLTASAITADASADATGTATFARFLASDGTTVILDCNVGTSGSDINFNTVSFTSGSNVSISSLTITDGNA